MCFDANMGMMIHWVLWQSPAFFFAWTSPDGCILLLVHLSFAKWCAPNAMCFLSKSYQLVRFSGLQLQQELPAKIISRSFCRVSPEFCNIFLIFRPVELLEDPWSLLLHHHGDASHVMADHHDYPIPSYETPPCENPVLNHGFWRGCLRGKNLVDDRWWQLKLSNKPSSTKIMHWSRSCMPCMPIKTAAKRGFYHPSFSKHNYISQRELVPWKLSIISWNHHFQWFKSPFLVVKIPKSSNEGGPIKVHGLQIGPCSTCGHTIWVQPGRLWLGIGHKPWKIPSGKPWKTITMKSDEISIWCFFFLNLVLGSNTVSKFDSTQKRI